MLGKKHRPLHGIHTGSPIPCTEIHFDHKTTQSPKGINKSFDFGGVGLGIVAALQISGDGRVEFPANRALITRNWSRSNPIPVSPPPKYPCWGDKVIAGKMESESLEEEYTIVTHHYSGSANKSRTKVYGRGGRWDEERLFRTQNGVKSGRGSIFLISPARFGEGATGGAPAADFLISCHLCRKKLQGEDIFMYRGEKAFCSTECRYREIMMDERRENCSSEATRGVDLSSSGTNANGQIFATGILAI